MLSGLYQWFSMRGELCLTRNQIWVKNMQSICPSPCTISLTQYLHHFIGAVIKAEVLVHFLKVIQLVTGDSRFTLTKPSLWAHVYNHRSSVSVLCFSGSLSSILQQILFSTQGEKQMNQACSIVIHSYVDMTQRKWNSWEVFNSIFLFLKYLH